MRNNEIGYVCNKCKKKVGTKHFTAEDGRILCKECSKGIKSCSEEIKSKLRRYSNDI